MSNKKGGGAEPPHVASIKEARAAFEAPPLSLPGMSAEQSCEYLAIAEIPSLLDFYKATQNPLYLWEVIRRVLFYDFEMPEECLEYLFRVAQRIACLNLSILCETNTQTVGTGQNTTATEYSERKAESLSKAKSALSLATFELAGKHHPFDRLARDSEHRQDYQMNVAAKTRERVADILKPMLPTRENVITALQKRGASTPETQRKRLARAKRFFPRADS